MSEHKFEVGDIVEVSLYYNGIGIIVGFGGGAGSSDYWIKWMFQPNREHYYGHGFGDMHMPASFLRFLTKSSPLPGTAPGANSGQRPTPRPATRHVAAECLGDGVCEATTEEAP